MPGGGVIGLPATLMTGHPTRPMRRDVAGHHETAAELRGGLAIGPCGRGQLGGTFWFRLNTFAGSQWAFATDRRRWVSAG